MSENTRKNKPPKRIQSRNHSTNSELSSKHRKGSSKTCIPLKTTGHIIEELKSSLAIFFGTNISLILQPGKICLHCPSAILPYGDNRRSLLYCSRYILFGALSNHLFRILSLSCHYFNNMETIHMTASSFRKDIFAKQENHSKRCIGGIRSFWQCEFQLRHLHAYVSAKMCTLKRDFVICRICILILIKRKIWSF